jgi:trigger factor
VPGFEDQLIGMKKGETGSVAVRFPEDYHAAHLAGKEVVFAVGIQGIRTKKLPEIDEEFVKNFERYESLEALRADVRNSLEEEKRRRSLAELERNMQKKLLENNEFEVPASFVDRQIYYLMSDAQRRMAAGGMDPKKAAEFSFKLRDQFREEALRNVKTALLLKNIAGKEALTVSEEELDEEIRQIGERRGKDPKTVRNELEKDDLVENVRSELLNRKTYAFLKENARITQVEKTGAPIPEEGK